MKKLLYVVLLAVLLASCATIPTRLPVPPSDYDYVRTVWAEPFEFALPEGPEADLAWSRAQVFVSLYGAPLAHAYKFGIQTIDPRFYAQVGGPVSVAYKVTRLAYDDEVHFTVIGMAFGNTVADRLNARMLVYYMKTGVLRPYLLNLDLELGSVINPNE